MNSEEKFFVCKHCGNIVQLIDNKGVPIVCCGEKMTELVANTVEASFEKHLPVVNVDGNKIEVSVGSVPHPMEDVHHICFIYVKTKNGGQLKKLAVNGEAKAVFTFVEDEPVSVYEYCNLHGLWKTDL